MGPLSRALLHGRRPDPGGTMDERNRDLDKSVMNPARDDDNVAGNLIGEAVGGVSGIAAGMALGSLGGPVGAVIGGLAGALGGWWAGRAVAEAAHNYTP